MDSELYSLNITKERPSSQLHYAENWVEHDRASTPHSILWIRPAATKGAGPKRFSAHARGLLCTIRILWWSTYGGGRNSAPYAIQLPGFLLHLQVQCDHSSRGTTSSDCRPIPYIVDHPVFANIGNVVRLRLFVFLFHIKYSVYMPMLSVYVGCHVALSYRLL